MLPSRGGPWPEWAVVFALGTRRRASECIFFGSESWDTVGCSLAISQLFKEIVDVTSLAFRLLWIARSCAHTCCYLLHLTRLVWKILYDQVMIQTEDSQLVEPISKYCSDPLEMSLVLRMFLCLEKCTVSHRAQLNFPTPCGCHSSCWNVPFPTAVTESSIQTNQAELTTSRLNGGSASARRVFVDIDTKVWILDSICETAIVVHSFAS